MNMIKYEKGGYVNADRISFVRILESGCLIFAVDNETTDYHVTKENAELFLNLLQAMNTNLSNLSSDYRELIK